MKSKAKQEYIFKGFYSETNLEMVLFNIIFKLSGWFCYFHYSIKCIKICIFIGKNQYWIAFYFYLSELLGHISTFHY